MRIVRVVLVACLAGGAMASTAEASDCGTRIKDGRIELQSGLTVANGKAIGSTQHFDCWMPKHAPEVRDLCSLNTNQSPKFDFTVELKNSCKARTAGNQILVTLRVDFQPESITFDTRAPGRNDCGDGTKSVMMFAGAVGNNVVNLKCTSRSHAYAEGTRKRASYSVVATEIVEKKGPLVIRRESVLVPYDPEIALERAGDVGPLVDLVPPQNPAPKPVP